MNRITLLAAVVTVSLGPMPARSQTSSVSQLGPTSNCGTWLAHEAAPASGDDSYFTWSLGFLSGYATGTRINILASSGITMSTARRLLLGYCELHPSMQFERAVLDLASYLATKKTLPRSPNARIPVTPDDGGG